jgi:BlaI family penicillinase repressor
MPPTPTDAELDILRILWDQGECSVRDVHEALADHGTVYTTTLKLMQIMADKGLVTRREAGRAHQYRAAVARETAQQEAVDGLLDRLFAGSAKRLVLQALDSDRVTPAELAEIRRLIESRTGGAP